MADLGEAKPDQPLGEENILKPKTRKAPSFTPEQRQAMSERMRKVNADRIANSKNADAIKAREAKAVEKEAKRKELEAEIERLKAEALAKSQPLAKLPKKPKTRKPPADLHEPNYDELLEKARAKPAQAPVQEEESESEEDVPPPPKTPRKPRAKTVAPAEPKLVVKFL
jgi:hypothetical protein